MIRHLFYAIFRDSEGCWINPGFKFFCSKRPDQLWGPPILLFTLYRKRFLEEDKAVGAEVEHLYPSSAEVKKGWSCTSVSPVFLHGMERDVFETSPFLEILL
jgi:hypothetical protein